jgi:anti-anti-sigma regulatory factor
MNASAASGSQPGSVLRYGNPAFDCDGAWIRALSRQLATVITVGGSVSAENSERITAFVKRFIIDKPVVLDLGAVESIAVQAGRLLDTVGDACDDAGVEWVVVAGDAMARLFGDTQATLFPIVASVPDALDHFAQANLRRRTMLLPLLTTKLTKSA